MVTFPQLGIRDLSLFIGTAIFSMFWDNKYGTYFVCTFCLIIVLYPFVSSWIVYNSKLIVDSDYYKIVFGQVVLKKGEVSRIKDIYEIPNKFDGFCFIKTQGRFSWGGFGIFYSNIPPSLAQFKKIS